MQEIKDIRFKDTRYKKARSNKNEKDSINRNH